jgi:hypothetical protein
LCSRISIFGTRQIFFSIVIVDISLIFYVKVYIKDPVFWAMMSCSLWKFTKKILTVCRKIFVLEVLEAQILRLWDDVGTPMYT